MGCWSTPVGFIRGGVTRSVADIGISDPLARLAAEVESSAKRVRYFREELAPGPRGYFRALLGFDRVRQCANTADLDFQRVARL